MNLLPLFISILIAQAAGLIGSIFTFDAIPNWYETLTRPEWGPPNWLFGPVWITLYCFMGIAAYLIWKDRKKTNTKAALSLYAIQLALNTIWSIIFFGLQNPALAFAEIVALWLAIVATTVLFWRINKAAAILFFPYLAWVSFAAFLNYTIVTLN